MTMTTPATTASSTPPVVAPTSPVTAPVNWGTAGVILARRRLALSLRNPRSVAVPVLTPLLFALVIAPALANTITPGSGRTNYMTYIALATAGLLIPLNCMFSGLGVIVDRQQGAMRELLVAPIRRSSIVVGNLLAALSLTAFQLMILIAAASLRGAAFVTGLHVLWFLGAALLFAVLMYGMAEILATRLASPEEYIGALPVIAIVPFFFAGSLFPITALPHWLDAVAKVLPLTHALALFRYGLTAHSGVQSLHNIWGLSNVTAMASLSLLVVALWAVVIFTGAIRLFTRAGTS
jgi:ABC-2 type transport system permease protein